MSARKYFPSEMIGKQFGKLKILKFIEKNKVSDRYLFLCHCGGEKISYLHNVIAGKTKSCGCLQKENLHKIGRKKKHGMGKTSFYHVFAAMKQRCGDERSNSYKNYGARGIKVEWDSFEDFKNDMYESYISHKKCNSARQTTIERLDVNGNYSKENCVWATMKEQMLTRRYKKSRLYEVEGEKLSVTEICKKYGVNKNMLNKRLIMGWNINKAIFTPSKKTIFRNGNSNK